MSDTPEIDVPPERRREEGFAEVLVQLARALDLSFHTGQLASILESCQDRRWTQRVLMGLDILGARSSTCRLDARQAFMLARRAEGLLVTFLTEEESWLLLSRSSRKWAECVKIDAVTGATHAVQVSFREFEQLLDGGKERQDWIQVEPRLTMQIISPPDAHDLPAAKKAIRRVRGLVWLEREGIWAILVYSILLGLLSLLTPIAVQAMVNTIAFNVVLQPLVLLAIVVLVGLGFMGALRVLQHYVAEYVQRRIFVRLVNDLSFRLPRVELEAHEKKHVPELVNRFFDVVNVQKSSSSLLLNTLGLVLQMGLGLLVLAFYHPYLLAFDVALTLALFFVVVVLGRGAVKTGLEESDRKYATAAWLEEVARHPLSFKSKRGEHVAAARAEDMALQWLDARSAHFRVIFRQIIGAVVVQAVANAGLLSLGGYLVVKGQLTLGQLVAAELIVTSVTASIAKIGKDLESYYDLVAGLHKVGKLIDLPLEPSAGELPPEHDGKGMTLSMSGVSTARGTGRFADATLEVHAGERIGLTGTDGAALTTLLDVLYGVRIPCKGVLKVDGVNLHDLSISTLRDTVTLVRGADIFEGTIEENLRLGQRELSSEKIRVALEAVGLLSEIERLPKGLTTSLGATGAPLSMDQLQRLTLARALLFEPRLILLDHSLDVLHQEQITASLSALRQSQSTTLIVSHRHSVLSECDRVFEMTPEGLKLLLMMRQGHDGEA